MDDPLVLHKYDPNWPNRFVEEEQAITDLLGEEVIAIHHVGSTSVPGLLAKSIIDIALEIRQYPPSQALIEALASIGYEHMGESGVRGRHWFRKGRPRSFHIHAVPQNGEVARAQVQLRDFLRKHPEAAKEYEDIKKLNAEGKTIDSAEYAAAKGLFIERVLSTGAALLITYTSTTPSKVFYLKLQYPWRKDTIVIIYWQGDRFPAARTGPEDRSFTGPHHTHDGKNEYHGHKSTRRPVS